MRLLHERESLEMLLQRLRNRRRIFVGQRIHGNPFGKRRVKVGGVHFRGDFWFERRAELFALEFEPVQIGKVWVAFDVGGVGGAASETAFGVAGEKLWILTEVRSQKW